MVFGCQPAWVHFQRHEINLSGIPASRIQFEVDQVVTNAFCFLRSPAASAHQDSSVQVVQFVGQGLVDSIRQQIEAGDVTHQANPSLSVVLCSHNRGAQAVRCLERFDVGALSGANGELVLVDNASTDDTRTVFEEFRAAHSGSRITVVTEQRKGLSIARNTGVRKSSAEITIFLDDDVYLGEGHLQNVLELFNSSSAKVGIAGGRILRFDPEDSLYCCQLSERHHHYKSGSTVRPGALQGSNFVIRRSVFDAIGGFDVALGAGQKYRCEDIDFIARALQNGWEAVYEPSLVVYHHHGRRDGEDVESLQHDNSYASGAYFAKMLRLGYWKYWGLLTVYVLSAPIRPNMKLASFLNGWKDYRDDYPAGPPT
jgi:GT2 family glycosyltransferase